MKNIIEVTRGGQCEYQGQSTLPKELPLYASMLSDAVHIPYQVVNGHELKQYANTGVARTGRKSIRVTSGEIFLLAVGAACIGVGIGTGVWPVALAGIGPCLLALVDISERKSRETSDK